MRNSIVCLVVVACLFQTNLFGQNEVTKIKVGAGPEDMVLDTITNSSAPRLILGCATRRKKETPYQSINYFDINSSKVVTFFRQEPADICLHPHGLDLVKEGDDLVLYLVSHCDERNIQTILRYKVGLDTLYWLSTTEDMLFTSPNAVTAVGDGSFLVSNDANKRGSVGELLFKQKKCKVVYCKEGKCEVVADKICFGNGIIVEGNNVYQASTLPGEIYVYDFDGSKLSNRKTLAKVAGADNLRFYGDEILVAGHFKFGKFIGHMKNAKKKSPTTILAIHKTTGAQRMLYQDSGEQISAASTAIIYGEYLYVSQIFDDFIVKVKLH